MVSSLDIQVLENALSWVSKQRCIWLCTVLQTWGSAPRAPGSLLAVSQEGAVCGSLSGGCIEQDFLQRLAAGDHRLPSQQVRYGTGGCHRMSRCPAAAALMY